jgi:APA family basic amino acid/polyamine antiporter
MIGTGIFTSLGFQVGDLPTGFAIMALWLVGGVCAMCGALSYAELGAALPRSGGEYHFLSEIYHPSVGFVAGWISATAGFSAPAAISAMAFAKYLCGVFPALNPLATSLAVVWLTTLFLLRDLRMGSMFQDFATLLKVALVLVIIGAGIFIAKIQPVSFLPHAGDGRLIVSAPFAVSLVYVMYAYTGWNASTYIVGEMRNPSRSIPLSVIIGTLLVMVLYLAVNAVFLLSTPASEMAGKVQVGLIAGAHLFGAAGGKIMALFICVGLVSSVSAMMWVGPRVTVAMGEDLRALRWFARKSAGGIPVTATLTQFAIVHILLLTSTFESAVNYVFFTLTLCSALAVAGVFVLRWRRPELPRPYRTWGYPVTPLVFLAISAWMLWHMLEDTGTRAPSLWGLVTAMSGLVIYFVSSKSSPRSAAVSVQDEK